MLNWAFFLLHFVLLSYFEHLPWLYSPHKTIHIKPFCSPVRLSPAIGVMSGAHYQSSIQELLHLVVTFAQCSPYSRVRQLTRTELAWQVKSDQCLRSPHSLTKFLSPFGRTIISWGPHKNARRTRSDRSTAREIRTLIAAKEYKNQQLQHL